MDEPFGALDAQTRTVMQEELIKLARVSPRTVLFITHAVDEAVYLADRVVVMTRRPGRVSEIIDVARLRREEHWDRHERIEDVMDEASFVHLRTHIWRLLREQQARNTLLTIGLTNDESAGNALVATAAKADGYVKNPQSMKGQTIVLTANSTGDYAVQSCLAKWGLKKADVTVKSMGQAEIISAMSSNNADLGGLWAPNIYTMGEKAGAKVIWSGKDTGTVIPGALVVRADYAKEQPQNVAKFLAVYLRTWKWMNAHQPEAIAMMKKFYEVGGVTISDASMKKEFDTRPTFDLAAHLKAMDRSKGASQVDQWMTQIAEFMKGAGTLPEAPAASAYVTDEYMRLVDRDPKLKEFANRTN